jgi:hypothetical protein
LQQGSTGLGPALLLSGALLALALPVLAQEADRDESAFRPDPRDGSLPGPSAFESESPVPGELTNVGLGPLRFRTQSPIQALRLGILPNPPTQIRRGHWEFRETVDWSRLWALSEDYLLDFDAWSAAHSVAYGVTDHLQLELGVVESGWSRAKTDGFVRGFHELFGIDQRGRDARPKGDFAFQMKDHQRRSTVIVEEDERENSAEQLLFSVHQVLTAGSEVLPAIGSSLTLKTNLRESAHLRGSPVDLAASISFAKKWGDFHAYVTTGFSWYGSERFQGLELKPHALSLLLAVEWALADGLSLVLQHQGAQGAVKNLAAFSKPSHEIALGAKIQIGAGSVFEVGVIENIIVFDNSPDFGMHAGLTLQF